MNLELVVSVLIGLIGIIGYFLKIVHSDIRRTVEEVGKNKGRIEILNEQISNEKENRKSELQNQERRLEDAMNQVNKSIEKLNKNFDMLLEKIVK
jgi:peptidoglycan hydrolase CwlO-like protein